MKKPKRNDPCICGSGKKFKKCCERKMIGKKFMATKIEPLKQSANVSSFFQRKIVSLNKPQEKEDSKKEEKPLISNPMNTHSEYKKI